MTFYRNLSERSCKSSLILLWTLCILPWVVLFGSYARNTWAEEVTQEEGVNLEFKSDYDILIVTHDDLTTETNNQWMKVRHKLGSQTYSTDVSVIQHSVPFINRELKAGGYFFTDVIKEGVALYHDGYTELETPGNVDPKEVKRRAKEEYELWYKKASMFYDTFKYNFDKGTEDTDFYKLAAFQLHQCTESLYTAALLYLTGYKGKIHDIESLGNKLAKLVPDFKQVFPKQTKPQKDRFDLLKRAYIDSRYRKSYSIIKEDLEYLSERVEVLKKLVEGVCGGSV